MSSAECSETWVSEDSTFAPFQHLIGKLHLVLLYLLLAASLQDALSAGSMDVAEDGSRALVRMQHVVNNLDAQFSTFKEHVREVRTVVTSLHQQVDSVGSDVSKLKASIDELQEASDVTAERVDVISAQVEAVMGGNRRVRLSDHERVQDAPVLAHDVE